MVLELYTYTHIHERIRKSPAVVGKQPYVLNQIYKENIINQNSGMIHLYNSFSTH